MPQIEIADCTFDAKGYASFSGVVRWGGVVVKDGKGEVSLTLEVEGGPANGKVAYYHGWMSPAAWPYTLEKMKNALGYTGETREGLFSFFDGDRQVGQPIRWSMKAEEYEGKTRAKVSGIFASSERAASRSEYLAFCASQGEDVKIPEPAAASEPETGGDGSSKDDLPFHPHTC